MPHILHLVKDPTNPVALDVIAEQARDLGNRLSVVLFQEAARLREGLPGEVYRLDEGGEPTADRSPHPLITYSELLDLIFIADAVVTW